MVTAAFVPPEPDVRRELRRTGLLAELRSSGRLLKVTSRHGRVVYLEERTGSGGAARSWVVYVDGDVGEAARQHVCRVLPEALVCIRRELGQPAPLTRLNRP